MKVTIEGAEKISGLTVRVTKTGDIEFAVSDPGEDVERSYENLAPGVDPKDVTGAGCRRKD